MRYWKASTSLIDYDEGHLSGPERIYLETRLASDSHLQQELKNIRLVKHALKTQFPITIAPRNPEALTQRILKKVSSRAAQPEPISFWTQVKEKLSLSLETPTLAWGAAAASLVLALIFGLQSLTSTQKLEALLHNKVNEKLLYQVASIAYQKSEDKARSKLELSELIEWTGEMDVVDVINRTGSLPSAEATEKILQPQSSSDKSLK